MDKLAMVFYGWHSNSIDARIIAAKPEILIDNTPAGYWKGNCSPSKFQSQGIKVFTYTTASYDKYDLSKNLAIIDAAAAEGSYGVFLDECNPKATTYTQTLYARAQLKGVKLMQNPGMPSINASIYTTADFVMTDEHYEGRSPNAVEAANLSKTIVIGFGNYTAQQAAGFTRAAWAKGFRFAWHEQLEYTSLPSWLAEYIALLQPVAPPPQPPPEPPADTCPAQLTAALASLSAANANITVLTAQVATLNTQMSSLQSKINNAKAALV